MKQLVKMGPNTSQYTERQCMKIVVLILKQDNQDKRHFDS